MKLISIFTFLLIVQGLIAQEVISSGGDFCKNTYGSVTYTIGEPAIESYSNTSNIITQGFNQTKLTVTSTFTIPELNFTITAFPNPTQEFVIIKTTEFNDLYFQLFNETGQLIEKNKLNGTETLLTFNKYSSGNYLIKINSLQNKEIKNFKIVKQ